MSYAGQVIQGFGGTGSGLTTDQAWYVCLTDGSPDGVIYGGPTSPLYVALVSGVSGSFYVTGLVGITGPLPAGQNTIGYVGVTGPVPVTQSGSWTFTGGFTGGSVGITGPLPAGQNIIGYVGATGPLLAGQNVIGYVGITGPVAVTQSGTWTNVGVTGSVGLTPGTTVGVTGSVGITGSVNAVLTPATSGGEKTNIQQALTTSASVKGSAGQLYGYAVYNGNTGAIYLFYYNATGSPSIGSTTNLMYEIGIPAGAASNFSDVNGIDGFSAGIYVAVSTSPTSAVAPSTAIVVTTMYK